MTRYFKRSGSAWIVGGGLHGQWVPNHRGLFIQNRSSAVFRSAGFRSRLAKGFRWRNDSKAILDEQSCERGLAVNATSRATPLQNLHIAIKWNGRVGNLMFEVAMLAGVLQRVREIVPETAASAVTFGLPSTASVPAAEARQKEGNALTRGHAHGGTHGGPEARPPAGLQNKHLYIFTYVMLT